MYIVTISVMLGPVEVLLLKVECFSGLEGGADEVFLRWRSKLSSLQRRIMVVFVVTSYEYCFCPLMSDA
jgi:hypothetical protein